MTSKNTTLVRRSSFKSVRFGLLSLVLTRFFSLGLYLNKVGLANVLSTKWFNNVLAFYWYFVLSRQYFYKLIFVNVFLITLFTFLWFLYTKRAFGLSYIKLVLTNIVFSAFLHLLEFFVFFGIPAAMTGFGPPS